MLVLSRQRDETIMIGDEIEITVVDIRGDKIRLGISAPSRIAVHRKEVYEAIRKENEQAAQIAAGDALPAGSALVGGQSLRPGPARNRTGKQAKSLSTRVGGSPGAGPPGADPPVTVRSPGGARAGARSA